MLHELIAAHPEIEIVAECANGFEAVKAVTELKPDLLFLDIQMPKLDGFEVLELVGSDMAVVFATAYDEYALKAFEVHAVDYLLKPFGSERFEKALQARAAAHRRPHLRQRAEARAATRAAPGQHFWIASWCATARKVHIIPIAKLDYVEAQDDYVALASEGHKYLKQQTIASLEAALDPKQFLRVHRSYIVNLERVARIEPYGKDSKVAILTRRHAAPREPKRIRAAAGGAGGEGRIAIIGSMDSFIFGIYPGGESGSDEGVLSGPADDPAKIEAAIALLQGAAPCFVIRAYELFADPGSAGHGPQQSPANYSNYLHDGRLLDLVIKYQSRSANLDGYVDFVRELVREHGDHLYSIQVTEEASFTTGPECIDGPYPKVREALVRGVLAAKEEARQRGLSLKVGFNSTPTFGPSAEFWPALLNIGGERFADSVDYVGLDFFPDVFRPVAQGWRTRGLAIVGSRPVGVDADPVAAGGGDSRHHADSHLPSTGTRQDLPAPKNGKPKSLRK